MQRIDHVGFIVRDLDRASDLLRDILGFTVEFEQRDGVGHRVELFRSGEVSVELIEDLHPLVAGSFREGAENCQFHHVAVEVGDIAVTMESLARKGVQFNSATATVSTMPNGRERSTVFTLAETTGGVIYQFIQFR